MLVRQPFCSPALCMHASQGAEQRTSTPLLVHCMKSFPSREKASSLTCRAMVGSQPP